MEISCSIKLIKCVLCFVYNIEEMMILLKICQMRIFRPGKNGVYTFPSAISRWRAQQSLIRKCDN
jgi:hypothetical protein